MSEAGSGESQARRARRRAIESSGGAVRDAGSAAMTGTLLTVFLVLMVVGIPVAIAMAGSSFIYIWCRAPRRRWWSSTG